MRGTRAAPRPRRARIPLAAVLLGLALQGPGIAAGEAPALERREGRLVLTGLPDILAAEEVREHLTSGLTTTFALRLTVSDRHRRKVSREGQIALRYDLWDEVFQLAAGGFFDPGRRRLGSYEELTDWWRAPPVAAWSVEDLEAADPWQVRIEVDLIPFSSSEQRDTQRWLAESVGRSGRGPAESVAAAAEDGPDPATNVLNLLVATSIRRESLLSWSWTVEVPP